MKQNFSAFIFALFFAVLAGVLAAAPASAQAPPGSRAQLQGIQSWGYNIQKANAEAIIASPYDLVVIDYSRTGEDDEAFTPDDLRRMQVKPDGSRRIVLAYMSIGEAESYRYYWHTDWAEPLRVAEGGAIADENDEDAEDEPAAGKGKDAKGKAGAGKRPASGKYKILNVPRLSAPTWLGRENEGWAGNFLVRYWDKNWQDIIFGSQTAYLDRIIAAGFDGVFLDRVDAFSGVADERPTGRAEMVDFVKAIATYARKLKPGFAIVPQNGEDLLLEPSYLATIDGIAKEDLLFGHPNEGQPNPPAEVAMAAEKLTLAVRAGLPVLTVEYILAKEKTDVLRADLTARGFKPYFGVRTLDRLVLPEDLKPAVALAAAAAAAKNAAGAVKRGHAPRQAKAKGKAAGKKR